MPVVGSDAIDPGPAPLNPFQPRRQQFAARHVVLMERPGRLQDRGQIVTDQHRGVGHEAAEQVGGEQDPGCAVVGNERPREMQIGGELEFHDPVLRQRQLPAVLLHQPGVEAEAVELDQRGGPPLGHHLHLVALQHLGQPGKRGGDVRVGVMTDQPADRLGIGDPGHFGHRGLDRHRRARIEQHPSVGMVQVVGMALEPIVRQANPHPPHALTQVDRIIPEVPRADGCLGEGVGGGGLKVRRGRIRHGHNAGTCSTPPFMVAGTPPQCPGLDRRNVTLAGPLPGRPDAILGGWVSDPP